MKVVAIYGNTRQGNTYHAAQLVLDGLKKYGTLECREVFLPLDLPHFCHGCFSCFMKGEQTCPHAQFVSPIVAAMTEADLILLASPSYGLDVSGAMKAFIDHLCFMWISHRPNPAMLNKAGLSVVTTAGAGLRHSTKTLRNSLRFWGVKRIFSFKKAVAAAKWSDVSDKKKKQMTKKANVLAGKIVKSVSRIHRLPPPVFRSIMFKMMAGAMKKNAWSPVDRAHWVTQGWVKEESKS
jgi:multimeric flavodoxin WrbA